MVGVGIESVHLRQVHAFVRDRPKGQFFGGGIVGEGKTVLVQLVIDRCILTGFVFKKEPKKVLPIILERYQLYEGRLPLYGL